MPPATDSAIIPARDPMVHDLHLRVSRIETEKTEDVAAMATMQRDIHYMREGIDRIGKGLNRVLWAIMTPVLTAVGAGLIALALEFGDTLFK